VQGTPDEAPLLKIEGYSLKRIQGKKNTNPTLLKCSYYIPVTPKGNAPFPNLPPKTIELFLHDTSFIMSLRE
jgi:hypothetical protein